MDNNNKSPIGGGSRWVQRLGLGGQGWLHRGGAAALGRGRWRVDIGREGER